MKRHFANYLVMTAGVLALVCLVAVYASAQQKTGQSSAPGYGAKTSSKALPEGGPAPRTADGHTDFSGVWFIGLLGKEDATLVGSFGVQDPNQRSFDPKVTPEQKPSFQPWAAEKLKQQGAGLLNATRDEISLEKLPKAQQLAAIDLEITKLSRNCMPHGVPGMFLGAGRPIQLVSSPGLLVQLAELNHDYRIIPTDGRAHTKDPDPAFNGEGVGHWDGDTLVVDTVAIDERVWNSDEWTFHSDQEHVIERITRPSLNYLTYQVTIDDPKVLTKPWTSAPRRWSLGRESLLEWYCGVNPHDDEEVKALKQHREQLLQQK